MVSAQTTARATYRRLDISPEALASISLFSRFELAERARVARHVEGRQYAPRSEIVAHRSETRDVFFLISGRVQATIYSAGGKVVTYQELRAGEMFGELAAIDGQPRSTGVFAISETTVARMSGDTFMEQFWSNPAVGQATLTRLSNLVRFLCGRILELHALPVHARVCSELVRLADLEGPDSGEVQLSTMPTQVEIANRAGTHREAVTRELGALVERKVIRRDGKTIVVLDLPALRHRANEPGSDTN